jgi:hypothetical protein
MSSTNTCMGIYEFNDQNKKMFASIIKPLIETHTGLTYVDAMSRYESLSIKMDLISRMIEEAKIVIIDLSLKNPNVFLELGIAYALKKPMVLLCSEKSFKSKNKKYWGEKIPFDVTGRELLIFENNNDLKVKLGRFISDCLFKTQHVCVSWSSENATNHIKSNSELEIFKQGNIWSNAAVNSSFIMSYRIKIHNISLVDNPDIRLFLSNSPKGYPRIVIIFPWEGHDIDQNKFECHIDYFKIDDTRINELRLQQKSVGEKDNDRIKEFEVFISFCWPNLVFESTFFEDTVKRLLVPISQFRDMGYPVHLSQFIGFEAKNDCHITIDNIVIKEIYI